jgi:SAM-dependent methyltransferase
MDDHDRTVEEAFTRQAAAFEDPRANRLFTTDSDWLFERLPLAPTDLVLEVAAGTGHVARRLAPAVRAIVALDATRAMLEQGRPHAPANVILMEGDAAALPFLDRMFDIVVSRFALHHFEEPAGPVAEMRRVLRPGGRLALADIVAETPAQDRLERLRDPSHTRLLTRGDLAALAGTDDVETRSVERPLAPWLEQTHTPPEAAAEIRAALIAELDGGPTTGFHPRRTNGELAFVHTIASAIAPRTRAPAP